MNLINHYELMTKKEIEQVMVKDIPFLTTANPSVFIQDNHFLYYSLVNTWLWQVKKICEYSVFDLRRMLLTVGLVKTLAEIDGVIPAIMKRVPVEVPYIQRMIMRSNLRDTLQVLRYPKRFSPSLADKVELATVQNFINTDNAVKMRERKPYSRFLLSYVRHFIEEALAGFELVESDRFPSNVAKDACSCKLCKIYAHLTTAPDYLYHHYNNEIRFRPEHLYGEQKKYLLHSVKVAAVPKTYKTARIIALEDVSNQRKAFSICDSLERTLIKNGVIPTFIPLHDQAQQQRYAEEGSRMRNLSTIDLSHASDTISTSLVKEIFPLPIAKLLIDNRPTHYTVNGTNRVLHTFATAGTGFTFLVESLVFYAIARAACEIAECETKVSVYGDDIIIHTDATRLCIEMLEHFGFTVNIEKSFYGITPYRESCGEEYLDGENVTSVYYPRVPIQGIKYNPKGSEYNRSAYYSRKVDDDSLASLTSLQHRLFERCEEASIFLTNLLKDIYPQLTSSAPGSKNQDLWDYVPECDLRVPEYSYTVVPDAVLADSKYWDEYHYLPEIEFQQIQTHGGGHVCSDMSQRHAKSIYNVYRYERFLREGPRYSDPLLKLLGVTEKDSSLSEVSGTPRVKWRLRKV